MWWEAEVRAGVRLAVERDGVKATARTLGLSPEATVRIAGGIKVQKGTLLVAREGLPKLEGVETVALTREEPVVVAHDAQRRRRR